MEQIVKFILSSGSAREPTKAHDGDAAFDLYASSDQWIAAGDTAFVPTGLAIELPEGYAGLVLSRSGLAFESGIWVANAPGLIDAGYRGDIGVLLHNSRPIAVLDDEEYKLVPNDYGNYKVTTGDRIAQLLIVKLADVALSRAAWLSDSERADGGFGSTGR